MKTIMTEVPEWEEFAKGRKTVEIGYPWLTPGAIMCLERIIKPDWNILEFGCGGSTLFFAQRCGHLHSMDFNLAWINKVNTYLPEDFYSDVVIELVYMDTITDVAKLQPDNFYDLILVDIGASRAEFRKRLELMYACEPKLKTGGFMVIDNYMRRPMRDFHYEKYAVWDFDELYHVGRGTRFCQKR